MKTLKNENKKAMSNDEGREEWHASPKPKKPLSERLDSLSNKILREQFAKERQLRKELVVVIEEYITIDVVKEKNDYRYYRAEYEQIKTLIQKAKEHGT